MLHRNPRVGDKLLYKPDHGREIIYKVVGHHNDAIINIQEDGEESTVIIWKFGNGETNRLLTII